MCVESMDALLERVCSTVVALACEGACSSSGSIDTIDCSDDIELKKDEIAYNVLKKQSVSYVTCLSWSLLCDLEGEGCGKGCHVKDRVSVARDVISSCYKSNSSHGNVENRAREYVVGILLIKSIHVVCSDVKGFREDDECMQQIRHVLTERLYRIVCTTQADGGGLVVAFVETVDVSGCWDVLVESVKPTMEDVGRNVESPWHMVHVQMACVGVRRASLNSCHGATRSAFLEYMHGRVFYLLMDHLTGNGNRFLQGPLVLLHEIVQSIAMTDESGDHTGAILGTMWDVCCKVSPADALGLLVQYVDAMIVMHVFGYDDENLWHILEWGLLHQQNMQKKRGMYVLERLIEAMPDDVARQWKRFLQLFTALDDTSLHLFKAHWSEMSLLHPEGESGETQRERLPFFWIELIWRMAVSHQQTTAQKLALVSFLNRKWNTEDLNRISNDFLYATIIPALGQAGVYSGTYADDIETGIHAFFRSLADSRANDESFGELVTPFLKSLSESQQQNVIMFCARVIDILCESRGGYFQASTHFLDLIGAASNAQCVFGSNYVGITCHQSLMRLSMMSFAIANSSDFERLLLWIGPIPHGLIYKGGALHELGVSVFNKILSRSSTDIHYIVSEAFEAKKGDVPGKEAALHLSACVKAVMLICETQEDILQSLTHRIESGFIKGSVGISDQDYHLLSSMMETFIPLDGNVLFLSTYNEYIISQCDTLFHVVLPYMIGDAMNNIENLSITNIERIYLFCLDQMESKRDEAGSNLEDNIEGLMPPDVPLYRESLALQLQTVGHVTHAVSLMSHKKNIKQAFEKMFELLHGVMQGLMTRYKDIVAVSPEQICGETTSLTHINLARHCLFEIRILVMRLLASVGDTFGTLIKWKSAEMALEEHWIHTVAGILELSVQSLEEAYPEIPLKSVQELLETDGAKKTKKKSKTRTSIQGWLGLCTWRSIASCLVCLSGHSDMHPVITVSTIVSYGQSCLYNAPNGDPIVIPIMRCFRQLIPVIVKRLDTFEDVDPWNKGQQHMLKSVFSSLIHVMGNQTRGRLGISAAIVSSVAHPFLFSSEALQNPKIDAMHLKNGAIHDSICSLVSLGQKYNRLLVQVSSHLGALLVDQPKLGMRYINIIEELSLSGFGSEASLLSLRDQILDKTTASEVSTNLTCVPPTIAEAYAQAECAPRVGILCLLHEWIQKGIEGDEECMRTCRLLWESLYSLSRNNTDLSQTVYSHGGIVHRKKVRLWQALIIISPCIHSDDIESQFKLILEDLGSQNAVTVKQYQEIVGATLVIRRPTLLVYQSIFPAIDEYTSQRKDANPCLFSMISVVISHFDQRTSQEEKNINKAWHALFPSTMDHDAWKNLLMDSLDHIMPWTGAFPHANRTFAQIIVWSLLQSYPEATDANPLLKRIALFLDSNRELKRLHVRIGICGGMLERFDVIKALKPTSILCGTQNSLVRKATKHQTCENAPVPLVQEMLEYLLEQRQDTREKVSDTIRQVEETSFSIPSKTNTILQGNDDGTTIVWQRKITPKDQLQSALQMPWKLALGTSALQKNCTGDGTVHVDAFEAQLYSMLRQHTDQEECSNRQEIVVVASLIDRLPNLAGLTRTCEIFRAQKLILGDISVQDDPDFASISVSANNWCPLEEVKPDHVCAWLEGMRRQGYRLVGLEQTDSSISLPEYTFESKTVLMLGAEKEGIPANILNILDDTIEIPQRGIIRSLNVHVSAAITLYQYTCLPKY